MAYLLSPGVLATEQSYDLNVNAVSTTTGATVIASEWGRCEEIVSVFSENDILSKFYKPTISLTDPLQSTYLDFFTMSNFFNYGNNLKVIRLVGDNARNANAAIIDGVVSSTPDLIIKNSKEFESRRNSGLLENIAFVAKYPSGLGNSIAVSLADKYSFPHWRFKTAFDYPPGDGEFSMVVIDTGKVWSSSAYLNVIEKFEGLSFIPGDRKYDGSSKFYKTAINAGSQYIWVGEKDISDVLSGKQHVHTVSITDITVALTASSVVPSSTRVLTYTPTGGAVTTVQPTLYTVSGSNLLVKPEVISANGNVTFTQTKSFPKTVTPTATQTEVISTLGSIDLIGGDTVVLSYLGDTASSAVILAPADYVIATPNTITIDADVLAEDGVVTVSVTRAQTVAVTATNYEITLPGTITLSSFQNIDVVYEKKALGYRKTLKSTDFSRNNGTNKIIIDAGIISTVASGDNIVTVKVSKDPNSVVDNIYSNITMAAGVSDNNIGELNDDNTATVVNGFYAFRNPNSIDISLILMGQYLNPVIVNWVISNVAEVRQDCVVYYSPPLSAVLDNKGKELEDVLTYNNAVNYDSTYKFMDSGWRYQYDRYNDTYHWTPLNPDTAGLCARTDYTNDPWWSPAGFNRGKYANVIKLAWNPGSEFGAVALSGTAISGERDDLYQAAINPVVTFQGEGTILFGDKTGTLTPTATGRINVRRLFIFVKKAISRVAKYFLFEFNDPTTQQIFIQTVTPFLRDIEARRGVQQGGFKVICDSTVNTPAVIDRNEFKAVFLIKPNKSINFVYLQFSAVSSDSNFAFSEGTVF